ncbi:CoA transferase [Rhodococcus pyridinivorans]|uniref:CaiB/BaiF CoA transferase family protein n=1 Tax=Rhodococcus pyridinivorans TaxID=103816 RepID=UPI002228061D|nr:CaiB/BaiF CoA-transferase family protein [Rhodococcus pyridinivorans]MCW3472709.1 CoA transferase [Rhodococcus pyridinivorans]
MSSTSTSGPLSGIRVVELAGLGPCQFAGKFLAELGADVVVVDRPGGNGWFPDRASDNLLNRGKRSVLMDLRQPEDLAVVLDLITQADILIEGYRPGVTERLGLGPNECLGRNPRLIYGRMTGWGQEGPLSQVAGHDLNYIGVTGVVDAMGYADAPPVVPLNVVGDFGGGGNYLVIGVLSALVERSLSGAGQVIDAAIVDGAAHLLNGIHAMMAVGAWGRPRGENLLDGGAPFYTTYATADGRRMAVCAIEPAFYAALLTGLGLDISIDPALQNDRSTWPALRAAFEAAFATRTQDEWSEIFNGTDACVSPVLSLRDAARHPHVAVRRSLTEVDGIIQAGPAPRFSRSTTNTLEGSPSPGQDTARVLHEWGVGLPAPVSLPAGARPVRAVSTERNPK